MEQLYMFAIMPPPELSDRISNERKIFAAKYKCIKALKPPVHITLYPPFKELPAFEERISNIASWVSEQERFTLALHNYGFFKTHTSPVVYIAVVRNPILSNFHKGFVAQLSNFMDAKDEGSYTPHFTIGYRDVPRDQLSKIESEYSQRTFSGSFEVQTAYLWRHDGKSWQILQEYKLGQ